MTRRGAAGPSGSPDAAVAPPAWPPPVRYSCQAVSPGPWSEPGEFVSLMSLPVLRSNPERRQDQEQQEAEERHQALGHRPDPAQAEAARVGLGPDLRHVGDDVPLLLRRDRQV